MIYEIESDVPIPAPKPGRQTDPNSLAQALRDLSEAPVGSSIYFPSANADTVRGSLQRTKYKTAAQFSCRKVDGGVRVWRVG